MKELKQGANKITVPLSLIASALILCPKKVFATDGKASAITEYVNVNAVGGKIEAFAGTFGGLINGVMGLSILTAVLVMIVLAVKLGASSNSPMMRMLVVRKIAIAGICTACLGSVMLIYNLVLAIIF